MGLMIFGQKFDIGNCFIVLSNCRKSENGYYGAIFSYQLSFSEIMWHFVHVICCK